MTPAMTLVDAGTITADPPCRGEPAHCGAGSAGPPMNPVPQSTDRLGEG